MGQRSHVITVSLNNEEYQKLKELAAREHLKMAQVVRRALYVYYRLKQKYRDIVETVDE